MTGEEDVSTYSGKLWLTSRIRVLGLCHNQLSGRCHPKNVGSLDLLVYLGGSIWKWFEDPQDAVHPGDYPEAFAYEMNIQFGFREGVLFQFPRVS